MATETSTEYSAGSAANQGLATCPVCHKLSPLACTRCPRCNSTLQFRTRNSIQVTLSLALTALLFYIPANIYPIMSTEILGGAEPSTIIGGVILFLEHGSYFIAGVIFVASVVVPVAKMAAIFWLCYAATRAKRLRARELTRLYRVTEFIGKWSMIDVYVVAILVALIRLAGLMSIYPGIAANAFACVVILTMISAQYFDVRLIWDKLET